MNLNKKGKIILVTLIFLISNVCISQVKKFKIMSVGSIVYDERTKEWNLSGEKESVDVLGVVNLDEDRVTLYYDTILVFDLIETKEMVTDKDGDDIFEYVSIDNKGNKCRLRFAKLYSQNGIIQLWIVYDTLLLVHDMYWLD